MSDTRLETHAGNRKLIVETATVIGATFGIVMIGSIFFLSLDPTPRPLTSTLLYLAESLGWRSLIWAVVTVGIAVIFRAMKREARVLASTVAGGFAVVAAASIRLGPSIPTSDDFSEIIVEVIGFVIWVLLGWAVAIQFGDRSPHKRASLAATLATALLIFGGTVGIYALFLQWADLYFRIWSSPPVNAYDDFGPEGMQYLITASVTICALVAASWIAFARRERGPAILAVVLLIVALGTAFIFQVPSGRFTQQESGQLPDDYRPCYGDTGYCPGG